MNSLNGTLLGKLPSRAVGVGAADVGNMLMRVLSNGLIDAVNPDSCSHDCFVEEFDEIQINLNGGSCRRFACEYSHRPQTRDPQVDPFDKKRLIDSFV